MASDIELCETFAKFIFAGMERASENALFRGARVEVITKSVDASSRVDYIEIQLSDRSRLNLYPEGRGSKLVGETARDPGLFDSAQAARAARREDAEINGPKPVSPLFDKPRGEETPAHGTKAAGRRRRKRGDADGDGVQMPDDGAGEPADENAEAATR